MWNSFRHRAAGLLVGSVKKGQDSKAAAAASRKAAEIPRTPQPQWTELLKRYSERSLDSIRAASFTILERTSDSLFSAAKKTSTRIETAAKQYVQRGIENLEGAAGRASGYADSLRRSAGAVIDENAREFSNRLTSAPSSTRDEVYRKSRDTAARVSSTASSAVHVASNAASQTARQATKNVVSELRDTRDKTLRWFFVWSLAVVGVYAFASNVPAEIRRYMSSQDSPKVEQREQPSATTKQGTFGNDAPELLKNIVAGIRKLTGQADDDGRL